MKRFILKFSPLIVVIYLISCQKTITITPIPYTGQVSISCLLEEGKVPKLYLSKSVEFFSKSFSSSDLFISDAIVKITSGNQTDILQPSSEKNYFLCQDEFFYLGKFPAEFGKTYQLTISYHGNTYSAETTLSQSKPKISSVEYTQKFNDVYGEHEGIIVNFEDIPNQQNNYRFFMKREVDSTVRTANNKTYRTECNGANKFPVIEIGRSIYPDQNTAASPMSFTIEPAFTHKKGQKAKVYIQTIDSKSTIFFDAIDRQKLATFNPFVEPVFLKSQIAGCIGVFGCLNISEPIDFEFPE
jgi:Domain of unknown function (DUF4249)